MKKRIWELDAFRGLCILGMIAVHLVYDLTVLYPILDWQYPDWFSCIQNYGGYLFVILSGLCATLGSRSLRRGVIVFCCGMLCTLVTALMVAIGSWGESLIIYFGVLHCLGLCMIAWGLFKKFPTWLLVIAATVLTGLGFWFQNIQVESQWLFPLGLTYRGFATSDYFPLLPNLGLFLMGAVLGRTVYTQSKSLLPRVNADNFLLRSLQFCGRHSLEIYLLHQPLLAGVCTLIFYAQGGSLT